MAHYRNLTVDGVDYRFVIGKTAVRVIKNSDNSDMLFTRHPHSSVYMLRNSTVMLGVNTPHGDNIVVTPKMIADVIRDGKMQAANKYFDDCGHPGSRLLTEPFDVEIHQKTHYVIMCDECYDSRALDI